MKTDEQFEDINFDKNTDNTSKAVQKPKEAINTDNPPPFAKENMPYAEANPDISIRGGGRFFLKIISRI